MCGLSGIFGRRVEIERLQEMISVQRHRGPDDEGVYLDPTGVAGLGHNRLAVVDPSPAAHQPMGAPDARTWVVFNGEIYNHVELRGELSSWPWRTRSDTEVILAAWDRWGEKCLERFVGMFAFLLWDEREKRLFAARDRFGVKPLYYGVAPDGALLVSSEIKALHAAGLPAEPDEVAWASYLAGGLHDHSARTFWEGVRALPGGCWLLHEEGRTVVRRWYDLASRAGPRFDARGDAEVAEEYRSLLRESVRLRFRSDVPVGINLSGGLDSSLLLGLVREMHGPGSDVKAFTFATGDPAYDEWPWVERMLRRTRHPALRCLLRPEEVPALAESVALHQDEPFGGLPTLAYARLFEKAREEGVTVLLDGQGMDEQWAGYDYYRAPEAGIVQGTRDRPVRPECLRQEFAAKAEPLQVARRFPDELRNLQLRDALQTKIPRALRFNDRVSARASRELREPFLDHRLFELALRQPETRKIRDGQGKWLLRRIAAGLAPRGVVEAPKRPLQTPQREWLRGPLRAWAAELIGEALAGPGADWLDAGRVRAAWEEFAAGRGDNSFFVWQWIGLGLLARRIAAPVGAS